MDRSRTAAPLPFRPRLLLTGFGPFPGAPRNPTAEVVHRLAETGRGERLGVEIRTHVFATTWAALDDLPGLIAEVRPHLVLHLGLKRRATAIAVESCARNRANVAAVDAEGCHPPATMLDPDGPPRLAAGLPIARMVARIAGTGSPVEWSDDAGRYLCNALFWRSLRLAAGRPTGFLHLPPTRELAGPRGHGSTVEALTRATAAAITAIAVAS
ncbi:MAG: pyroglutamyl-peptidase I [Siculibacillus sp.]|nr:pyroglutamyl-peptidase I [Siculibacillus sp.]